MILVVFFGSWFWWPFWIALGVNLVLWVVTAVIEEKTALLD